MTGFKYDNVTGTIYFNDVDYLSTATHAQIHADTHVAGGSDDLLSSPGDIGGTTSASGIFTNVTSTSGVLYIKETFTPTNVSGSGYGKFYTKINNKLYFKAGDGVEYLVGIVYNANMFGAKMFGNSMFGVDMFKQEWKTI